MHRYGIAAKCIKRQHVKMLRGFPFQGKSRIARHKLHLSRAIAKIAKPLARHPSYFRIDFVKSKKIPLTTVSSNGAGSKSHHPDAFWALSYCFHCQANAALLGII